MHQLYEIANMSYAKHILYLVDACYGGLALAATRGLKKSVPNYIQKITREKGRQIITAGGKDEQVLEAVEKLKLFNEQEIDELESILFQSDLSYDIVYNIVSDFRNKTLSSDESWEYKFIELLKKERL